MIPDEVVIAACRRELARGSKSFHAASRMLPARLRDPVAAFYAFCRVSDDAVDESADPARALDALRGRLDAVYAGRPGEHFADRGLAWVVEAFEAPRAPLDALLEGYAWDVAGRRYEDVSALRAYCVRVAASVGVFMTHLMCGRSEASVLARAADLGVAMQLTNVARDVGEDARMGRLYLPLDALAAEGVDPDAFVEAPRPLEGVRVVVAGLLEHAEHLYRRSELGVPALPADCRGAILAARHVYGDIGRVIRQRGHDSVTARAVTTRGRKAALLAYALATRPASAPAPDVPPLPEARVLL